MYLGDVDNEEDYNISPEHGLKFKKEPQGFIPSVIDKILQERFRIKREMKASDDDTEKKVVMKILLFGITNVGKSTIGKMLSKELKYDYDDLDDEIKKRYKRIDTFREKYPYDYDRHRKRGEILLDIIKK